MHLFETMLLTDIAVLFAGGLKLILLYGKRVKKVTVRPVISLPLVIEAQTFCAMWMD